MKKYKRYQMLLIEKSANISQLDWRVKSLMKRCILKHAMRKK